MLGKQNFLSCFVLRILHSWEQWNCFEIAQQLLTMSYPRDCQSLWKARIHI